MNKLFDINYIDTNVLVVDKETVIKTNEVGTNGYVLEYFRDRWQEKDWFKVIASTVKIEGVPLIKLEDDFESIHSLAFNEAFKFNKLSGVSILDLIPMYIKGYKEAKCKQYSEEDIRAAIDFGKSIRSEKSHINENFGSPYIDYEDSTEETELYIKSLQSKYKQVELEMEEFGYFNEELDDDVSEGFRVKVKNDYVIVKNLIL